MEWTFIAVAIEWRGPAPFVFVPMPVGLTEIVKELARGIEYWGQVPVEVTVGKTTFTTAMWPKDGRYLVPIKLVVQRAERVLIGKRVKLRVQIVGRS